MQKTFFSLLLLTAFVCTACGKPVQTDSPTAAPLLPERTTPSDLTAPSVSCTGGGQFSGDSLALADELARPILNLLDAYYLSIGNLELQPCRALFSTGEEADWHEAVWRSLIEIRKASLIDLHLVSYDFTLTVTDIVWYTNDFVEITVTEDAEYRFAAIADTLTQQYGTLHTFCLARSEDGVWRIDSHNSDDNPYYNFDYAEDAGCDSRLEEFLQDIAARQVQQGTSSTATRRWDHDYDREAAYDYMQIYIERRSDAWAAYDDVGGNCQNFGSQVLLSGGIPMDEAGNAQWYWYGHDAQDYSWINVDLFLEYAQTNSGFGLVADTDCGYYTGQTGDILIMGDSDPRHTTVIADTINDENGNTVDYLLCSNTSNYRNFPASAYYYTKHWLVRIYGWNE